MSEHWWQHAVVYQVYVRSFADADGDGIGDLEGLRRRLEHIASLGVDAIWLCPIYPSPQRDHGYDVADYVDIEPAYGDLADVRPPRRRRPRARHPGPARRRAEPLQRPAPVVPGRPARRPRQRRAGPVLVPPRPRRRWPPNNWPAAFGGSVWTAVGGDDPEWYLGTFTPVPTRLRPPPPRRRRDVRRHAALLVRPRRRRLPGRRRVARRQAPRPARTARRSGPASSTRTRASGPRATTCGGAGGAVVDDYMAAHPDRDLMLVAEAYTPKRPDILAEYTRPDEFHQCFAFDLLLSPWHGDVAAHRHRRGVRHRRGPGHLADAHAEQPRHAAHGHALRPRVEHRRPRRGPATTSTTRRARSTSPSARAGRGRRPACCSPCPAPSTSTWARSSACPRCSTCPTRRARTPCSSAPAGAQIGRDGCRVPMPWTAAPADAFGFSPPGTTAAPWMPPPADWGSTPPSARTPTRRRCWRSTGG